MTSQNPNKSSTPVKDDAEQTASERPEVKKELTDDEIAAVAGGFQGVGTPTGGGQWLDQDEDRPPTVLTDCVTSMRGHSQGDRNRSGRSRSRSVFPVH